MTKVHRDVIFTIFTKVDHQFYLNCTHFWCTQDLADPLSKWVISSCPAIIGPLHSLHTEANLAVSDFLLLLAEVPVYVLEGVLCELLFRGNVLDKCLDENGVALLMLGGVCGGVEQLDVSVNLLNRALGLMSRTLVLFVTGDLW